MARYANHGGDSGIVAFETGSDWICVTFEKGGSYLYTYSSTGLRDIEEMKALAHAGEGLNSFINRNVRNRYESKGC